MEDHSFSFGKTHDFRSPKATKSSLKTVLLEKVRDGVCLVSDSSVGNQPQPYMLGM